MHPRPARRPARLPASLSKNSTHVPAAVAAGALIAAGEPIEALLAALPPQALPLRLTPQEALFFQCLIEATAGHGIAPPPPFDLPASIARVVDYEHVKAFMARKMLRETGDSRKQHRERVQRALKRAREALTAFKVVGVYNPYIWHTGKPVCGLGLRSYTASS